MFVFNFEEKSDMELLEFKNKILKLCNVNKIENISDVLMNAVMTHNTAFFDKFNGIIDDSKDWLQALWQYYQADRIEKKQDYTPKTLCKLVSALAGKCETLYDCCGGSGALSLQVLKDNESLRNVYIEELDSKVIPFLLFNLCLKNAKGKVINGNVLNGEIKAIYNLTSNDKYSVVSISKNATKISAEVGISNPPYNIKWEPPTPLENDTRFPITPPASNANYAFIFDVFSKTDKSIFILPNSVLESKIELECRKWLIDNDYIETVIVNPDKMFEVTGISTCILILNKNKKNKGKVNLIYSFENCVIEERKQNGQYGSKAHTNRTYKKKYNVYSDENIKKILNAIENQEEIKEFSVVKTNEEIANKKYRLSPSIYFDVSIDDFADAHRDFQEIADNINYIQKMKNACKLTINETLAKSIGFDVKLYKDAKQQSKEMKEQLKIVDVDLTIEDYIQFTKNKNEFVFKCNDKEFLPDIFMQFLAIWKNQIALLNTMQNQYLAELRDALLPELMSGKIEL
ncbi:MAG TPA: N-6 DNA methylase [Oscillospiraceae bacterium]|jgi:type I restriction-modification system DNA methylase subunit|nr:N-6 DNA methylase [Ruminococcus sp. 1001270H_150608_F2]HJI49213.1 N-6 DNA methylase [Oscillospiraceae bacterium]